MVRATADGDGSPSHEDLIAHCLDQPEAELTRPFGDEVMVFKVAEKMFALVPDSAEPPSVSLKGDPLDNQVLRQRYAAVTGGYHLNKVHWNTIIIDGEVPADELFDLIEDSYDLVVNGLPKRHKLRLQGQVKDRVSSDTSRQTPP
jgi:predicted DNA-binding protein (MmcQ/YjbR family)